MKLSSILGLNARTKLYSYRYNTKRGKYIANSKIQTARVLKKAGIPSPKIFKKFVNDYDIENFAWSSLPSSFALKPSRGLGGEGIIVVKKKDLQARGWITTQKRVVTIEDLKFHATDIIEGAYSMGNIPDVAFIQEFVGRHKTFRKYAYRGTPDIRVIVFNKVPVMAMLRLPTKESGGRANLHQGAIAVGIDIATGITTWALWHQDYIKFKPQTEKKLNGIKIPEWDNILRIAVETQIASGLGYAGVDVVLHPEKGPMVLEINAQPGLQIQLANKAGLKKRLERVEDLEVSDGEHGVKIAKALFSSSFAARVREKGETEVLTVVEEIILKAPAGRKIKILAKIDTGAWRSSIDKTFAKKFGLLSKDNILWTKKVKSSLGYERRPVISLTYWLKGRKISTIAGVADRKNLKKSVIIGRRDLSGFIVKPVINE